jgi:hypothetical protein
MSVQEKTKIGTIDLTPTWEAVLLILIETLETGSEVGKNIAKEELLRMARLADMYVVEAKAKKAGS